MDFRRVVSDAFGVVGIASLVGGCSLLYEPRGQCNVDSDCIRLARTVPEVAGSLCQDHVCSVPKAAEPECETNSECIAAAMGDPAICREFSCVRLRHGACNLVVNAEVLANSEDVILLGAFAALGVAEAGQQTGLLSYQLAINEMQQLGGAVGYKNAAVRRPFVFVVCEARSAPQELDAAFDHLTKTLRVPVAITTVQPLTLQNQWTRLAEDETVDTMFISAFATDSSLSFTNTGGYIWSLLGDPSADLAPAYVQVAKYQMGRVAKAQPHVLIVTNELTAMLDIAELVERELPLGDSVVGAINQNVYRRIRVKPLPNGSAPDTSEVQKALEEVNPDVVIVLGGEELIPAAITNAEVGGPSRFYVLSHHLGNSPKLLDEMPVVGSATSLDQRVLGVNYAGAKDRTLYETYWSNLKSTFPSAQPGYENFYDAAHFAMFSVVGAAPQVPTQEITGSRAVSGFRRLIDLESGSPQRLERRKLPEIQRQLETSGLPLALIGTMGPPNFSTLTGARHTDANVWCYRRDEWGDPTWEGERIRYDRETATFNMGLDRCQATDPLAQ